MDAHHVAAALHRKSDIAGICAHHCDRLIFLFSRSTPAPLSRGMAEHERGAGRRIFFMLVVHLKNFDIVGIVKNLRRLFDQFLQQIDARRKIARLHKACFFGVTFQFFLLVWQ